ncbi:hypothetical protein [Pararhizobium sp. LjRoot238]|uniref:hypothetical protein n=1 Tax=Pararhizobium sp. LjRoot238 TaxID=3342293 RepID=UPI003ECD17E6
MTLLTQAAVNKNLRDGDICRRQISGRFDQRKRPGENPTSPTRLDNACQSIRGQPLETNSMSAI